MLALRIRVLCGYPAWTRAVEKEYQRLMLHRKIIGVMAASALALAGAGCGESNGLHPVSGKVLHKGEPAVGATVSFYPKDAAGPNGEIPRGEVEADGSFQLGTGDLGRGAPPGQYAVLVEWRQGPLRTHRRDTARTVGKAAAREGKPLLIADDRLKGRYFDIAHPRLAAEVKNGSNTLPPFNLTD
jgi:hypothetical protein